MIWATRSAPYRSLHIGDHLVAAVLAEIDVEVRHRHALGIEEALEQQPEADGIEIGDGERVGDERARARAAARADGNALRLGPFDEVGDDQEVALIVHAGDDIELEGEPLGVGRRVVARRHAVLRRSVPSSPASDWRLSSAASVSASALDASPPVRKGGRIGWRCSGRKAQRRAISTVLSIASGRSANSAAHLLRWS